MIGGKGRGEGLANHGKAIGNAGSLHRRAIQALWWSMRSVRRGSTRRSSRQSKSMKAS